MSHELPHLDLKVVSESWGWGALRAAEWCRVVDKEGCLAQGFGETMVKPW